MGLTLEIQLAVYSLLDVVPCALLTAATFRQQLRSRRSVALGILVLYLLNIFKRMLAQHGVPDALLSLLWIVIYLAACKLVIHVPLPKMLFVLVTVLNYASLVAVLYSFIGYRLFASQLEVFPYCMEASLTLFFVFLLTLPFMYYLLIQRVRPLMSIEENWRLWRFLWLVPATFCLIFYYNLYAGGGVLPYSSNLHNFLYTAVVGAGGFFVLFLAIRMVDESNLALRLRTENDLLTMQAIHYENLQSRMDEARCARHDLRQCAAVLEGYLRSGNDAELRHFVAYYLKTVSAGDTLVYTQNTALNALIVYYADLAAAKGTAFDARVEYPPTGPISDIDLAVLFGNLLENAVEACGRLKEVSRSIRLTVRHQGEAYVILLDNTCAAPPEQEGACFRSSKRDGQGIGVLSIRRIAEKYHGTADFTYNDGWFHAALLLNP